MALIAETGLGKGGLSKEALGYLLNDDAISSGDTVVSGLPCLEGGRLVTRSTESYGIGERALSIELTVGAVVLAEVLDGGLSQGLESGLRNLWIRMETSDSSGGMPLGELDLDSSLDDLVNISTRVEVFFLAMADHAWHGTSLEYGIRLMPDAGCMAYEDLQYDSPQEPLSLANRAILRKEYLSGHLEQDPTRLSGTYRSILAHMISPQFQEEAKPFTLPKEWLEG